MEKSTIGGSAKLVEDRKRAVVLLSGGIDSAVCMAMALSENYEIHALIFNYEQRHNIEIECAQKIVSHFAKTLNDRNFYTKIFDINLRQMGGSSITNMSIPVPEGEQDGIPNTYVPGRNVILLSIGIAHAEIDNCEAIFYGANFIDYSGYPDCRPEFVHQMQRMAHVGYKSGVEGKAIQIRAPLLYMSKKDIIKEGITRKVPFELTWSCYDPVQIQVDPRSWAPKEEKYKNFACGKCPSCVIRMKAFKDAGINDPINYATHGGITNY